MAVTIHTDESSDSGIYGREPPAFGHPLLKYFAFDPKYINLNHGSYGSLPRPVKAACDAIDAEAESNPDRFHRLDYQAPLLRVRERVAQLIGARTQECVLVPNTSSGVNTVLRNLAWNAGDVLVGASTTYASVNQTLNYLHDIHPETVQSTIELTFPTTHAALVDQFRAHLRALPRAAPSAANAAPKVVAVIDSIAAIPGVLLPWREMVQVCREEGVLSIIDAAHSIGQEVGIDLGAAQPDFWVSNCHKWLFAKRGCAVLYVPERNRHIIKSPFPTSSKYSSTDRSLERWLSQFEWNGTIDFAPYLSVNAALDFRQWLGGEVAINDYCHDLAVRGGQRLAEILGTRVMDQSGELTLNMVNVELPLPPGTGPEHWAYVDGLFRQRLLREWNTYASHFYHDNRWWTRCSAQVFNEVSDFEYLGKAYSALCAELRAKMGQSVTPEL